ncbi:hypothetical protein IWW39_001276 [Coemansia spiralis]|uniref:Uncharacterized protein n=1 Tax=Coemansia spiralis TaxID=417178 RepID=A0A9W8L4K7_9FUNG|nr:hypothetical protein IWW39_001276 [Coemansia spiralis]
MRYFTILSVLSCFLALSSSTMIDLSDERREFIYEVNDRESGELDHHDNAEEAVGQLSYSTLLNSAKQHASNWQALQKENKLLKLVIDMKDSRLHERQTTIGDLYRQLAALEYRVRELEGGEKESEEEEEYEKEYYFDDDYFTEDSW